MGESEHRRFGRRSGHIAARVVLSGNVQMPCIIENLSDGGALLTFEVPAPKAASFRLIVEETSFNLLCEPRHAQGNTLGVRFSRLAEGIALNRHFQKATVEREAPDRPEKLEARGLAMAAVSVRDLRSRVIAAPVEEAPVQASVRAREISPAELLAAGCLPPGISFTAAGSRHSSRRPARILRSVRDSKVG